MALPKKSAMTKTAMAEVPSEIATLSETIARLDERLHDLTGRLKPVLSNVPSVKVDSEKTEKGLNSDLGLQINNKRKEIETLIDFVDKTIESLQL